MQAKPNEITVTLYISLSHNNAVGTNQQRPTRNELWLLRSWGTYPGFRKVAILTNIRKGMQS